MTSSKKASIQDLKTELGHEVIQILISAGWTITNEYDPNMIDKAIDFDAYTLSKDSEVLDFEWDNWFEWKITGSVETISMIKLKMK
jgi:hypothetical protein